MIKLYDIEGHNKQLTPEEVKQAAREGAARLMWAVCSTIDHTANGCQQDDHRDKVQTIAMFSDPYAAEDFIKNVLSAENITRFYIVQI